MPLLRRILVPLDGSLLSEHALRPAIALAQASQGQLTLMRVPVLHNLMMQGLPGYEWLPPTDEVLLRPRQESESYLSDLAVARQYDGVGFDTKVVDGDITDAIVATAKAENADLIIMTTHGRTGLTRWALGSITERVLRAAPCPVLAIRPGVSINHILFPLDGSKWSEHTLDVGMEIAQLLEADVTFLYVQEAEGLTFGDVARLQTVDRVAQFQAKLEARDAPYTYLDRLAARYRSTELQITTVVERGNSADRILDFANNNEVDLVAMATHGYSGLPRWIFGSTTQKVLHGTGNAVLLVHPESHFD